METKAKPGAKAMGRGALENDERILHKCKFQDPVVFTLKSFRFSTCQANLLLIIALHI
jgi:hypothetical protein